ncbi:unnamed protein product [Prorocentrum cordatum]|uniref:RanBP2-type domain-containing protein n=1 Tax=Prorocentrum cordatum TaxID=2364126 RepID=A0ABN9VL44_9DINO|nr:unnamed protein product [Polarella glacialis]
MARSSRGGGSGGRRSRTYWMCSCGGWNWDWRTTCLGCGYAAPPWALEAAAAKAKPQADKDGWVDQPRGRRAQRPARIAATSAATSKSQTSASGASGAPSGSGATAIERLQVAVGQLEALQAEPPDGVDCCFTDVVASQLEAKRAELAEAQRAAAEQKASSMPLSTMLHKEANAISKAEKRLRAARQSLEQKQEARGLVEAQLQKAQEELAQLDAEVEEVPGLLMQLDKLPEAWGSSDFEVAFAAIRSQVEAVRAQLAEAPAVPRRAPWAESCPMDEISSEGGDHAGGCRPWQPQCAAERGQAERRGDARGEWPKVAQACKRELAAEDVRCGMEELGGNGNAWRRSLEVIEALGSRSRAPPRLVMHQGAPRAPRRLEEARGAARRMGYAAFLHASAPTGKEGPLANSGGVAAWRHCLSGVTVSTASGLQLLACSLYLQGSLGPEGFNLDSFAAFGDAVPCQRPRFISVVGLATESFSTNGAVLAGCACATTVAKLPVLAALRAASAGGRPLRVARNVVGDIALQAVGAEQLVAARLGSAGLEVFRRLRVQHLPLSAAETNFLAPSPSLGALRRARRLDPIHKAGPAASRVCGRTVTGNAGGKLHVWRLAACRSAGALPMGAERGLRMRCAELRRRRNLDPAALKAGHAVQMLAGLLLTGELPPRMMERGLEAAATRSHAHTRARADMRFKSELCSARSQRHFGP